jgi:hypothetical protein
MTKAVLVLLLASADGGTNFVFENKPCAPRWEISTTGCWYARERMQGHTLGHVSVTGTEVMVRARCGETVKVCGKAKRTCVCSTSGP